MKLPRVIRQLMHRRIVLLAAVLLDQLKTRGERR
jgi:hypothetical protein